MITPTGFFLSFFFLSDFQAKIRQDLTPTTTKTTSLLTRFFGLHRMRGEGVRDMSFVVMDNVFFSKKYKIHEQYDLKGSTVDRQVRCIIY